jgi:hypothetical protein
MAAIHIAFSAVCNYLEGDQKGIVSAVGLSEMCSILALLFSVFRLH